MTLYYTNKKIFNSRLKNTKDRLDRRASIIVGSLSMNLNSVEILSDELVCRIYNRDIENIPNNDHIDLIGEYNPMLYSS